MASAFRPRYSKPLASGKRKKWTSPVWYALYFDHAAGRRRKKKGYADKASTEQLAARLERESAQVKEGLKAAPPGDLPKLIEEYLGHLKAKDNSPKYLKGVRSELEAAVAGCAAVRPADLTAEALEAWLAKRKAEEDISARTWNRHAGAMATFGKYLVKRKAIAANPFLDFPRHNEAADRRHVRRAVTAEEVAAVITAARASPEVNWLPGPDRAMLYTLACYTGVRANELAGLTPADFTLDGAAPEVRVAARRSKRRTADRVPLHPAVAALFRGFLAAVPAGAPVWPGKWPTRSAAMLRGDLAAAGVPYKDDRGRVFDFHAQRGQFITQLILAGTLPGELKELARHSTIELTYKRYADLGVDPGRAAVGKLPAPPGAA